MSLIVDTQRQKEYIEYVCSSRDKEEQEIRENMAKGIIGVEEFREEVGKKVIELSSREEGDQENSMYLFEMAK